VRPGRDRLSASSCAFVRTSSSRIARALASTKTALVEGPDVMWSRRGCLWSSRRRLGTRAQRQSKSKQT